MHLRDAFCQARRTRLEDECRFDLVDPVVAHCGDLLPARPWRSSPPAPACRTTRRRSPPDRAAPLPPGSTMRSFARPAPRKLRENRVGAGDLDQFLDPPDARDERLVPLFEERTQAPSGNRAAACRMLSRPASRRSASCSASGWHPTSPPSIRIIWRISAMLRWLNVTTAMPRLISSAARSACRSENASTRSGSSATILSNFALMNAEIRGFCRASGGRTV